MIHLLSFAGRQALQDMLAADPLLAFTFDGTLSPNVMLPQQARMLPAVARPFQALCDAVPVAVITGRSLDDVRPRLTASPKYLIGNHGADGLSDFGPGLEHARAVCVCWMHQIVQELQLDQVDPGLLIEDHGYSICLHYRLLRDRPRVLCAVEDMLARLDPAPCVIGARDGLNLLPPGAPNKRTALESLLQHEKKQTALYVGDDETDEIVFRDAVPAWLTVRIGRDNNSAARYFLHHQFDIMACLQFMLKCVKRSDHWNRRTG